MRLAQELVWLTDDRSSGIGVLISFHTLLHFLVNHHIDHVLNIGETLSFEMPYDFRYQLLFSPYEENSLFHHRWWNDQLLEVIDGDSLKRTSVTGKTLLVQFLLFLSCLDKTLAFRRSCVIRRG